MIFYEAPHKLKETLADFLKTFGDRPISLSREITKLHEETMRTTLAEAVAYYEENDPRGEYVLVLGGAEHVEEESITLEDAVEMAGEILKEIPDAAKRCADCREQLLQGADLAAALGENGLLSPSACRLLTLGMRSGTGDGIMETIAQRMQEEAQEALQTVVGKVEPALVLVTSGLVGVILLSVMLPLMNIMTAIG